MLARPSTRALIAYALALLVAVPSSAIAQAVPTSKVTRRATPTAAATSVPTPLVASPVASPTPNGTPAPTPVASASPVEQPPVRAPKPRKRPLLSTLGYGSVAVAENVVYVPAKLGYAFLGLAVGAGSWAVAGGRTRLAKRVLKQALGGDYFITPSMVEGKEPIEFTGEVEAEKVVSRSSQSTPEAASSPVPAGGKQKRPWWRFWGRKGEVNATPTPQPSATPTASAPSQPPKKGSWWHFWGPKPAPTASPTPAP